jgi:hypothetical protein
LSPVASPKAVRVKTSDGWQDIALVGPAGPPGSPLPLRDTEVLTTASLAAGGFETGLVTLAKGYRLLRVEADRACWIRLYTTTDKRTADGGRAINVDPAGDHGCVCEFIFSVALLGVDCSPVPQGYSMESSPSEDIPYRIDNLSGAAHTVTVTFTWQAQET